MSRLAYIPLPFAVGVAAARTLTALFPLLVASGLASVSGAGGEPLDPSRGAGEDAWLWLGLSAAWNLGMALTLVGAAIALLVRHPAARGAAWT